MKRSSRESGGRRSAWTDRRPFAAPETAGGSVESHVGFTSADLGSDVARSNHYRLFGALTVVTPDGSEHELRGRNAAVLTMLLTSLPDAVSTDRLVDEVWGDKPPRAPDTAVHSVVSRIRSIVGDDLVTTPIGYRIDPRSVDTQQFEEAVQHARASGKLADYELASARWTGEPLSGFHEVPSIVLAAERLKRLRHRSEMERLELLTEQQASRAADELTVFVERDPYDEEALRLQMRALNAAGHKPAALAAFKRYESLLAEETGLEPSVQIRELELAILVDELDPPAAPSRPTAQLGMTIEYLTLEDGRRIAIGRAGSGPLLVVHPGWLSKLDVVAAGLDFRTPFWAALSEKFELVLFDRHGTGLSRGSPDDLSMAASVAELRHVIRHVSKEPVPVWGASAAGPIAIRTAAENPELVSHLVLYGTYASGPKTFPQPVAESMGALIRASWGMGSNVLASLIFPGGSAETRAGFAQFQRESATREVAGALLEQLYEAEASTLLADLPVPALVVHYNGDKAVPITAGEDLARQIPDARYMPLEGTTHYPLLSDFERVIVAIERFVTS